MLGLKSSNFYSLKNIINKIEEKQDERISVSKENTFLIDGKDMLTHLKTIAPDGKLRYIKGETEFLYGFGNKIG
jgi:hypothetical protein